MKGLNSSYKTNNNLANIGLTPAKPNAFVHCCWVKGKKRETSIKKMVSGRLQENGPVY